jgi:hypothetical protein
MVDVVCVGVSLWIELIRIGGSEGEQIIAVLILHTTFFVVRERSSSNLPAPVQLPPQLPRTICRESTRKSNNMLTILEGSVLRNILVRWLPFPPLWLFLAFYWLLPLAWWRLDTDFIGTEENLWRDQFQDFFWQPSKCPIQMNYEIRRLHVMLIWGCQHGRITGFSRQIYRPPD